MGGQIWLLGVTECDSKFSSSMVHENMELGVEGQARAPWKFWQYAHEVGLDPRESVRDRVWGNLVEEWIF